MSIVHAFCSVSSQWRTITFASGHICWQGLDYAGARAGLLSADIAITETLWAGLQIMEREATAALNGNMG